MNKREFLGQLAERLAGLPKDEVSERLLFYSEMIDDRMEDGIDEEAAVGEIGDMDELVSQMIADVPLTKLVKERIVPKRKMTAWEIVFLVLGSPIWVSLLIAAVAVILSLYAVLWAVIAALWATFAGVAVASIGGVAAGIVFACNKNVLTGLAAVSVGLFCAGLSILLFLGCRAATVGGIRLTKRIVLQLKNRLAKKEEP